MTNLAQTLKQEIARLARKEVRAEVEALRKTVSNLRSEQSKLKTLAADQGKAIARLQRQLDKGPSKGSSSAGNGEESERSTSGMRFSAKGLASNRARLGLSAEDFGKLVGVTGQSIYAWEAGRSVPRAKQLVAIAELRGIGKKEVRARLGPPA